MEFKDLIKFIKAEDERLKKYYGSYSDQEKRILVRTVKLSEELGELCEKILLYMSMQRKDKLIRHNKDKLSEEFADVVITALLVARAMDVDIEKALKRKMRKISKRYR